MSVPRKELRPDKRQSGKIILENSREVQQSYIYLFDIMTQLEEHTTNIQEQLIDLNNPSIETCDGCSLKVQFQYI